MTDRPIVSLVDDDPSVRRSLGRLLRAAGLGVRTFGTVSDFLASGDGQACLVLDVHLPDMNGLELLGRLRETAPDLPVVIITGDAAPALRTRALQQGAKAFLEKPVDGERLLQEIRQLLEARP